MTKEVSKSIVKATGLVLVLNIVVKILGFLRESFIANCYGATWQTDAYQVAYTLPYFIQAILGYAMLSAVVPVLTKYWCDGEEVEGMKVANTMVWTTSIVFGIISVFGIIFAPQLVYITAPSLSQAANALAVSMTRIIFPSVLFMGAGLVMTGILNSRYCFMPLAAPGVSNIIIILGVVLLGHVSIYVLAWATLISFIGYMLVNIPYLNRSGFSYKFVVDFKHPAVKQVLWTILPISLGVAVNQIYFALNRIFASGLPEGSITVLNYASKVMNLPIGIFVAAVVAASYPALAEKAMADDRESLSRTLHRGLGLIAFLALPSMIGLILLRVPIVQILFQHGAFTSHDTIVTAYSLLYFSLGILPVSLNMLLVRVFYIFNDVKTPVIMGLISIAFDVIFSLLLCGPLSQGGLALANTLAAVVNMILLCWALNKNYSYLHLFAWIRPLLKMVLASVVMGVVIVISQYFINHIGGAGTLWLAIRLAVLIGFGMVIYFASAYLLGVAEIKDVYEILKKKFAKRLTRAV